MPSIKPSKALKRWMRLPYHEQVAVLIQCPEYRKAVEHYPKVEFQTYKEYLYEIDPHANETDQVIKDKLVQIRWTNPICRPCGKRGSDLSQPSMKLCGHCCLEFYCSQKCQRQDWPRHKSWCEATPDNTEIESDSPYRPAMINTRTGNFSRYEKSAAKPSCTIEELAA